MNFKFLYEGDIPDETIHNYECARFERIKERIIQASWILSDRKASPESFRNLILYLLILKSQQEYRKIEEIIVRVYRESPIDSQLLPYLLLIEMLTKLRTFNLEEFKCKRETFEALELEERTEDDLMAEYHNVIASYSQMRGKLGEAQSHYESALEYKRRCGEQFGKAQILNNIGIIHWRRGRLSKARQYLELAHSIAKEIGAEQTIGVTLMNFGNLYFDMGELDRAMEYFKESLEIRKHQDIPIAVVFTLNNIGSVLSRQGRLQEALEYYTETLEMMKSIGKETETYTVLNNIGTLLHKKGQFDDALEYYLQSLEIREKLGDPTRISLALHNIGEVYRDMGEIAKSKDYLMRALKYREGTGDYLAISDTLFQLIMLQLVEGEKVTAKKTLEELEEIHILHDNKIVELRFQLASALVQKESNRIREKIFAAEKLRDIISGPTINHYYTLTAMKALFDLLLLEYRTLKEEEIEEEIRTLLSDLYEIAHMQHSSSLLVETHSLQAKFALIEGDLERSKALLDDAKTIILEEGIEQHTHIVNESLNVLKKEFERWSHLVKDNLRTYNEIVQAVTNCEGGVLSTQILEDKVDKFNALNALPLALTKYKSVLHPIKLTILKILNTTPKVTRNDLLKLLGINSGTLEKHLKQLERQGYLSTSIELIDTRPRTVIHLETNGMQVYEEFKNTMEEVIST